MSAAEREQAHQCDGEFSWCDYCEAREKAKGRKQPCSLCWPHPHDGSHEPEFESDRWEATCAPMPVLGRGEPDGCATHGQPLQMCGEQSLAAVGGLASATRLKGESRPQLQEDRMSDSSVQKQTAKIPFAGGEAEVGRGSDEWPVEVTFVNGATYPDEIILASFRREDAVALATAILASGDPDWMNCTRWPREERQP